MMMENMENKELSTLQNKSQGPLTIGQEMAIKKLFRAEQDDMARLFTAYTKDATEAIGKYQSETIKKMNDALQAIDKRFSGMYGTLVNKFLIKQEQKVFTCEMGVQAILETTVDYLHSIEFKNIAITDPTYINLEVYKEVFQSKVENKMNSLAEELKKKAEEQMAKRMEELNKQSEEKKKMENQAAEQQAEVKEQANVAVEEQKPAEAPAVEVAAEPAVAAEPVEAPSAAPSGAEAPVAEVAQEAPVAAPADPI